MLPTFVVFLWIAQFRGLLTECETWWIPRNQPAAIQKTAYLTRIDRFFARHQAAPALAVVVARLLHGTAILDDEAKPFLQISQEAAELQVLRQPRMTLEQRLHWEIRVACCWIEESKMGIPWKNPKEDVNSSLGFQGGHFFRTHQERHTRHDMFGCFLFCSCFFFQKSQLDPASFCLNVPIPSASRSSSETQPGFERNLDTARPLWSWMYFSQKLWEWKSPMFLWPFRHEVWTESLRRWI